MNDKWNREDWQGRRKEQVEFSYKVAFYSILVLTGLIILSMIF